MQSNEQGFSLIELMLSVAIIALLGQQYASYTVRVEENAMIHAAGKDAHEQLVTGLNQIRKNMKSKAPDTAVEVEAHRLTFQKESLDGTIAKITMATRCRKMAGETFALETSKQTDATCYQSLACDGLPYIEIITETPGKPTHTVSFPTAQNIQQQMQKKSGVSGLGMCFEQIGDSLSIHGIQLVHVRDQPGNVRLTLKGLHNQVPIEQRNSISFIR